MKTFSHISSIVANCPQRIFIGILATCLCLLLSPAMVLAVNGPHFLPDWIEVKEKGACVACHVPHGGKGIKIWARSIPDPFRGTRALCHSCHDGSGGTTRGSDNVFYPFSENHVMHGAAVVKPGEYPQFAASLKLVGSINKKIFPLDPEDRDTLPSLKEGTAHGRSGLNYYRGGEGMYCGTCHNPHGDSSGKYTIGDAYLRSKDKNVGTPGKRKEFCNECHGNIHAPDNDCLDCHHPHKGATRVTDNEIIGRKIFIYEVVPAPFVARPNVARITDNPESDFPSTLCYGCHGPRGAAQWGPAGATTIHGDDSPTPREHHPMGTQAILGKIPRAKGCGESLMNRKGELTCVSCHNGFHQGDRANNFLRWDFTQDSALFCCVCHPDKSAYNLGDEHKGHHQVCETSPVKRLVTVKDPETKANVQKEVGSGNCMFCHFIHDGQNENGTQRGDLLTPDLDALMRVAPLNLAWADKWDDIDLFDYEDMCFGCHGRSAIVRGAGLLGSKLLPPRTLDPAERTIPGIIRFSHRFATAPKSETTAFNIRVGGKFPLSDYNGFGTLDDYGVKQGLIYCGTCHDVHNNRTNLRSPYLRGTRSPYVAMGFCEECHTTPGSTMFIDPMLNHPLGRGPDLSPGGATSLTWLPEFTTGLSGEKGGVTFTPAGEAPAAGRVICLTCHSVHAASTTFDGWADFPHSLNGVSALGNHGNLLVIDNYKDPSGSDMCIRCHPGVSGIVNSPHDFSPGYRQGCKIGQKGLCSACHVPHNAASAVTWNGKPILWARSLSSEESCFQQKINPAYTLGDTILCYDCHSRCNDDPPLAAYGQYIPQDVAFVDKPGGDLIGYYEIAPPWLQNIPPFGFKTGGHYIKSSLMGGIMKGDKLACSDCHDPHRGWTKAKTQNQAFIKELLGGKVNGGFYASKNMVYSDSSHGPRNDTESRLICVTCHGWSYQPSSGLGPASVPFIAVNPAWGSAQQITPPTPTVFEHSSLGAYACTDCHQHNRITVFCIDCHSFPPTTTGNGWSGAGDTDENYPGGAGAHSVHVFNCRYDCLTCHTGCLHNAGGATVANPFFIRSKVSVDFNPLFGFPRILGEYPTKMSYPGLPALYNPIEQTCFVGCHNPLVGDPDKRPHLTNLTPSWSLAVKRPTPPTLPSIPLPDWMPDPLQDPYYQKLLLAPEAPLPVNLPGVPWPLPAIP
ncbi:MAG: cytochrome c3 family protein [bacterium]